MKQFENLTFTNHDMFGKVLQNKDICKELLERLLKIKIETAKNMLNKNISIDVVGECTGLPLETIEQLKKELECML